MDDEEKQVKEEPDSQVKSNVEEMAKEIDDLDI